MKENNYIENYIEKFSAQKSRIFVLICSLITFFSSLIYTTETKLSFTMMIYIFSIMLSSIAILIYVADIEEKIKYKHDILLGGVAINILGTLLRTIQCGSAFSLRFFCSYLLFCIIFVSIGINLSKGKIKNNFIITLLVLSAVYSIFEIFYLTSQYSFGIFSILYRISELCLFCTYIFLFILNKNNEQDFYEKIGNYKNQIPSLKICLAIIIFIATISIGIGTTKHYGSISKINKTMQKQESAINSETEDSQKQEKVEKVEKNTTTKKSEPEKPKDISLGETISNENIEFTLNKVELSYDVMPDTPPSYYTHYPANNNQVYIYVNASIKNLKQQSIECDEIYSVTANYNNGYNYQGFNIVTDTDGDFTYANIKSVAPLQTLGVHCLINCPEEVEQSENPLDITIKLKNGSEYLYKIR